VNVNNAVLYVKESLQSKADPKKAAQMQAYMKTEMPFYGVQKPGLVATVRGLKQEFGTPALGELLELTERLWQARHREEKHLALELFKVHRFSHLPELLPRWEQWVREGAWWDFVDTIATQLVSPTYKNHREVTEPFVRRWSEDSDFWVRRLAILSHLKHKVETDETLLFEHCLRCAHEKEFFIRKAIGWALREYSKHNPESVAAFLEKHRERWSGLTYREGRKWLDKASHEKS
jgi:3-methyladenine DNA glycosylase AlkD